jgi:hypothetical protein
MVSLPDDLLYAALQEELSTEKQCAAKASRLGLALTPRLVMGVLRGRTGLGFRRSLGSSAMATSHTALLPDGTAGYSHPPSSV